MGFVGRGGMRQERQKGRKERKERREGRMERRTEGDDFFKG